MAEESVAAPPKRLAQMVRTQDDKPKSPNTWYMRDVEGRVFGPVPLSRLREWAAASRIGPEHMVSRDRRSWKPAPELSELKLEWIIEFSQDSSYGPIHIRAIGEILETIDASGDISAVHVQTGERWLVSELLDALATTGERSRAFGIQRDRPPIQTPSRQK